MISKTNRILAGIVVTVICVAHLFATEKLSDTAIVFLEKEEAKTAIIDDSLEKYFDQLQPMEMAAKTGAPISGVTIEEKRRQCRKQYKAAVLEFTEAERVAIRWHINKLRAVLSKDYPLIANISWSFLKVSNNIEGGLPHTRGNHIVLSESICKQIVMIKQIPIEKLAYLQILELFVHEQMHIFQRTHKGHCDSLYMKLWGFTKANTITGCQWLDKHHLANPDAVDCSWVLPIKEEATTSYLWPLVVFAEGDAIKAMPGDFQMIAITLRKTEEGFAVQLTEDGKPVSTNLLSVLQFKELFPLSLNIYHPDEASADMFAQLVIFDSFVPPTLLQPAQMSKINKHLAPLRKWFKENLKSKHKNSPGKK